MGMRPRVVVVNRILPAAKTSRLDVALVSLVLSITTSLAAAGWALFSYTQQTQTQWQQEVGALIKEINSNESANTETSKTALSVRRSLLIQQLEGALKVGKERKFSQPPEILSILGFSYAVAGYVESAAERWREVADSDKVALPVRLPAALSLRRFSLEGRSASEGQSSEGRLDKILSIVAEGDRRAAAFHLLEWAVLETEFRNFGKAVSLLQRASEIAISTDCNQLLRKEARFSIASTACRLEVKEGKQKTLSVIKTLYQLPPENKNWCPGDPQWTDSELSCENVSKDIPRVPGPYFDAIAGSVLGVPR